jgi:hypothetical protein
MPVTVVALCSTYTGFDVWNSSRNFQSRSVTVDTSALYVPVCLVWWWMSLVSAGSIVSDTIWHYDTDRAIGVRSPAGQRIFPIASLSRPAVGPTQTPVQWVPGVLPPGLKRGRGMTLTTHPHLVPRSSMSRSYTPLPPSAFMACSGTALAFFFWSGDGAIFVHVLPQCPRGFMVSAVDSEPEHILWCMMWSFHGDWS